MKDFWIGKYNGEYLIGKPEWYAAQSVWEAGRMTLDQFKEHAEINGLPNVDKIAPVEVNISDVVGHSDAETQLKYQGQWSFWQYTDVGEIDGIKGYVDFNIFNGSLEQLHALTIQPEEIDEVGLNPSNE